MRIEKLQLTRYGHFTDFELDFGSATSKNAIDLHVLYGPNEAGKSTTLSAITDLLHGMERKSNWNFLHTNETLLIEAVLQQSDQRLFLKRFKNHVADESGERLDAFPFDLQGLNRTEYTRRFSFDEQTLRDGGEQILKSDGDIGQALFSASAGLSDLKSKIDAAMAQANAFWMPNRTKNIRLKELKDDLQNNKKQLSLAKLDVSTFKALHKALRQSEKQRTTARDEKNKLNELIKALEVRKSAHHVAQTLAQQIKLRDSLRIQPIASSEASSIRGLETVSHVRRELAAVRELIDQKRQFDLQHRNQESAINLLGTELGKHVIDEKGKAMLAIKDQVEQLQATASASNEWKLQVSELEDTIELCNTTLRADLQRLQLEPDADIAASLPGEYVANSITSLIDEGRILRTNLEHALREVELLESSRPEPAESGTAAFDTSMATDVVRRVQREALFQKLKTTINERLETKQSLDTQAHQLAMSDTTLDNLTLPDESWLELSLSGLSDARGNQQQLQISCTELEQRVRDNQALCHQLSDTGVVSEIQLLESRQRRDTAWQIHKNQLTTEVSATDLLNSAGTFEQHLHQHDKNETVVRSSAEQSAQLSILQKQIQQDEHVLREQQSKIAHNENSVASMQKNILAKTATFYDADAIDNELLRKKFSQAVNVRKAQADWHKLNSAVEHLQAHCQEQCSQLLAVVEDILPAEQLTQLKKLTLEDLLLQIEQIIAQENAKTVKCDQAAQLWQAHEQAMSKRMRNRQIAEESHKAWTQRWVAAVAGTLLESMNLDQAADAIQIVRNLEATHRRLTEATTAHNTLLKKILNRDIAVSKLLDQFGFSSLTQLIQSLAVTDQHSIEYTRIEQQIKDAGTALEATLVNTRSNALELESLTTLYSVSNANEVLPLLERTGELRTIEQRCNEEWSRLQEITGKVIAEDELTSLLSENQNDELDTQLLDLQSRLGEAESLYDEYSQQWAIDNKAVNAIGDGNEYARLAQERANILMEMEEGARATAKARCGQLVLQAAISKYRQEHQSTLLANARQAFATLTAGHYVNLVPHDDGKGGEQLMATDAQHRSRAVNELSTGTRYQLYLALRAAAYADYARQRTPLPFVADDIMESFDDERSAAAFRVLGQMATHGQVLYMTHHQHLIDIARTELGEDSVTVHCYG